MIVYVLYIPHRRICKIGITGDLKQRLRRIRETHAGAIVYFAVHLTDARLVERYLHQRYAHRRLSAGGSGGTEWFKIHPIRPAFWLACLRACEIALNVLKLVAVALLAVCLYIAANK